MSTGLAPERAGSPLAAVTVIIVALRRVVALGPARCGLRIQPTEALKAQ